MRQKLNYSKVLPEGMRVMNALDHYSQNCGLETALLDLIKLRASQINGCAYCITCTAKTGARGDRARLYALSVYGNTFYTDREGPCFTERSL
jgi:alkylhydroperoxidase family enzyme